MRLLIVRVARGWGEKVLRIAREHGAVNLSITPASAGEEPVDLLLANVSNGAVEGLVNALQEAPDLHVTLLPSGVIALYPPPSSAPDRVVDVETRSPLEIFLGGLQSIGSWRGFLGYAAAAGVVVWIGLFTNTVYLLTAAMLIAPFAGPAMNAALATARGDLKLFGSSLLRYVAALALTICVAFALSVIFRQDVATSLMIDVSQLSSVAVLLPLVAGAAGALNLCQSDRSSLVSGAATGMLVAASLAPPAGLVGMGSALGEWDLVLSGGFVLLLQFVAINLSGALVFRAFGVSPEGVRFGRGARHVGLVVSSVSTIAAAFLVTLQLWRSPDLQRSSVAQRAAAHVQSSIERSRLARPVFADVRFTRPDIAGQNTLLVRAYVQRQSAAADSDLRMALTSRLQRELRESFNVTPLVDVTVLSPPVYD